MTYFFVSFNRPSNAKVLKDLATESMSVTNDNASDEFPKAKFLVK